MPRDAMMLATATAPRRRRRPGFFRRLALRFGVLAELAGLARRTGRYWLLPMVVVFLLAGVLLGVVQVLEYVAPFVYTMF